MAKDGFSIFHVRVPPYNIEIDQFVEVPMCFKCYAINDHPSRHCKATETICSECSEIGHRWDTCKSNYKKCINCGGDHKTTAPQCPTRKQEVSKMRQQTNQNKIKAGTTYSTVAASNIPVMPNPNVTSDSILKISAAIMYTHTINAIKPGSFNTEINNILILNNLPKMIFPDNPPSMNLLNTIHQQDTINQETNTEPTTYSASTT